VVSCGDKRARLTRSEYDILKALADSSPEPRTLSELYRVLYPDKDADYIDKTNVKVHIVHIRRKLKDNGVPLTVEARKGFGYRCVFS
jgi:DNA-binding response OmpR family regulator